MACEYCDGVTQDEVMCLAIAIETGDTSGARLALDALFRESSRASEWIARGRAEARRRDPVDDLAAKLAAVDGVHWAERCVGEAEGGNAEDCESSTCIAAHYEDHDPETAREQYRRYARAALGLPKPKDLAV